MPEKQLGLFDDDDLDNVVDRDYSLDVQLQFRRCEGDVETTGAITIGQDADYLDRTLPVLTSFLQSLGFSWVDHIVAYDANGKPL